MARDLPSPCCGSFSVLIKEELDTDFDGNEILLYSCRCGECGIQYGESAESRAEALYNYDERCLSAWRRSPYGAQEWLKTPPKDKEDTKKRIRIQELVNYSAIE